MHRFFARFNIVSCVVHRCPEWRRARTGAANANVEAWTTSCCPVHPSLLVEVFLWNIIFRHLARVYFFLVRAIRLFNPSHGAGFEHISFSGQLIYAFRVRLLCPRQSLRVFRLGRMRDPASKGAILKFAFEFGFRTGANGSRPGGSALPAHFSLNGLF
jgi:hypothetical protein